MCCQCIHFLMHVPVSSRAELHVQTHMQGIDGGEGDVKERGGSESRGREGGVSVVVEVEDGV